MFSDIKFVQAERLKTHHLPRAIPVYNIDGTPNEAGSIKGEVDLICAYGNHTEYATFSVTSLGHLAIILGHTWLTEHNPEVNRCSGEVKMTCCPESCGVKPVSKKPSIKTVPDIEEDSADPPDLCTRTMVEEPLYSPEDGDRLFVVFFEDNYEEIGAGSTISHQLAQNALELTPIRSFEDLVPKPYQEFEDVFSKESFDKLPPHKLWDHAIELIPGAKSFSTKVYPMSPNEQRELDAFLEENLKSHHIRPSKSPMASPVFFIKKKDSGLCFVQDYQKLNDITIKNA